jgi:hypothetical protein
MAFATAEDLGNRMKRSFSIDEKAWIDELLEDATAYLQGEIGQLIYPRQTVTYTDWPSAGRADLPQQPVVSVSSVKRDDLQVPYVLRPGYVSVAGIEAVDITFTFGHASPPRQLLALCCALVSQQLVLVEAGLGLSIGGLSSVALDDFKIAFADGGEATGLTLPRVTVDSIRRQFGRGDVHQIESVL